MTMKTVSHAHFRLSSSTPIRHSRRILMDRPVNASSYELGKRNRINFSRPSITARPPRGEQGPATAAPPLHGGGAGGTRGGGEARGWAGGAMMYGREGWNTGEEGNEGQVEKRKRWPPGHGLHHTRVHAAVPFPPGQGQEARTQSGQEAPSARRAPRAAASFSRPRHESRLPRAFHR